MQKNKRTNKNVRNVNRRKDKIEMYDNEMKLEFLSKSSNEAFARITVAAFVSVLDPTIEELADIKTAVSEAVTNAIVHGYEDKIGIVKILTKIEENVWRGLPQNATGTAEVLCWIA